MPAVGSSNRITLAPPGDRDAADFQARVARHSQGSWPAHRASLSRLIICISPSARALASSPRQELERCTGSPGSTTPRSAVLKYAQLGKDVGDLETARQSKAVDLERLSAMMDVAIQQHIAAAAPKRPLIRLNSVDLPAPLGPMMATRSPCCTARFTPRMISGLAEALCAGLSLQFVAGNERRPPLQRDLRIDFAFDGFLDRLSIPAQTGAAQLETALHPTTATNTAPNQLFARPWAQPQPKGSSCGPAAFSCR